MPPKRSHEASDDDVESQGAKIIRFVSPISDDVESHDSMGISVLPDFRPTGSDFRSSWSGFRPMVPEIRPPETEIRPMGLKSDPTLR